jgi:Arc/MetJ-type ribon-helix-helix transcriptional regulator
MKTIRVRIPEEDHEQLEQLIHQGWFPNRDHVLKLALRKFLNSNRPELLERAFHEDVEWGLRGAFRTSRRDRK